MAVTTTFSWSQGITLDMVGGASTFPAITTIGNIASGTAGFAAVGDFPIFFPPFNNSANTDLEIFNSSGVETASVYDIINDFASPSQAAIEQVDVVGLSNGNILVVGADNNSLHYAISNSAGVTVVANTNLPTIGSQGAVGPAVAAFSGGYVIASQEVYSGNDTDIYVRVYNNAGSLLATMTPTGSALFRDIDPDVAINNAGNIQLTWTRENVGPGTSEVWYEVFSQTGGIVVAAQQVVLSPGNHLRDSAILAATNGQVYIVYQDDGWGTGTNEISIDRYEPQLGIQFSHVNLTAAIPYDATHPQITELSNGMFAVSYTALNGDNDTYIQMVDASGHCLPIQWPYWWIITR
jgi:hypothetical protein